MTIKIKSWKVSQIMHDMSKYGDNFYVTIEGNEPGHYFKDYEDEQGFVKVTNVHEVLKETEKAVYLNIDGFKTWVPKSAIA